MLLASTGTPLGPFGFAGGFGYQEDGDTGLKLLGHRYYDPSTGRFLTRDPIKDGRNWYAYCLGNPLKWIDPEGQEPWWLRIIKNLNLAKDVYDLYKKANPVPKKEPPKTDPPKVGPPTEDPPKAEPPTKPGDKPNGPPPGPAPTGYVWQWFAGAGWSLVPYP